MVSTASKIKIALSYLFPAIIPFFIFKKKKEQVKQDNIAQDHSQDTQHDKENEFIFENFHIMQSILLNMLFFNLSNIYLLLFLFLFLVALAIILYNKISFQQSQITMALIIFLIPLFLLSTIYFFSVIYLIINSFRKKSAHLPFIGEIAEKIVISKYEIEDSKLEEKEAKIPKRILIILSYLFPILYIILVYSLKRELNKEHKDKFFIFHTLQNTIFNFFNTYTLPIIVNIIILPFACIISSIQTLLQNKSIIGIIFLGIITLIIIFILILIFLFSIKAILAILRKEYYKMPFIGDYVESLMNN